MVSPASALAPTAPAMRRGACPALSAPMQTGDGLLVRLATSEGGLTPARLAALCRLATRHGNGIVEVTARGSFQIRGLTLASAPLLESDVAALDLPLREGVPVETSPLAGLDPREIANPLPLARAIREAIAAAGLSAGLGPKVSVVVDGGGAIDLSDLLADVRLTAMRRDGAIAWNLAVGGTVATAKPVGVVAEEDAAAAVVAILEAIAARGRDARGRDLALPPPPASAVPLPRFAWEDRRPRASAAPDLPAFTGEGDHAKRGEGGGIALTDSRIALAAALPFGSIEADDLAAFARQAEGLGVADIRLAPARSLLLLCPDEAAISAVSNAARDAGLILDADDPRRSIAACPGSPACMSGRITTREIARRLAEAGGLDGSVHVSGCAKGCAHPTPASLVLVGTDAGVALVRDGRASDTPEVIFPDPEAALAALAIHPEPAE